ncbi:MAG: protein kinase, partial [Planctomycetota bacterium]|nr:protein kinase [Planctomycetota bacterium]
MSKNIDLLLGKIALEKGYLTRNQLDDCVAAQEREQRETGAYRPLSEIMLIRGVIDRPTLQELVKLQQEKFRKAQEFSASRREDGVFGQLLIQRKLVPADKVNECLRVQEQMAERDIHLRLGEVLVKKGCMTAAQVREVLLLQRKVIMTCPVCKKNYNVPGHKEGTVVRCPKCSTELRPPDLNQTISAAGTAAPGSAEAAPALQQKKEAGDFGRYDLLEELGEGGMGIVHKAWDKELRRLVALKMLKGGESQPQQVERFLREARAAAKLRHPNIVQIHDVGAMGDKHYFTMDFIEGPSLQDQMQTDSGLALPHVPGEKTATTRGAADMRRPDTSAPAASDSARRLKPQRIALRKGLEILRDIAFALEHAHSQGIVHRDIKPANILIDASGTPFLTDFGLAKDFKHIEKSGLTVDGQVIGTPFYLSPELAAGDQARLGPASDIYSLGVIMFELLTGKRPYQADSFIALMWEIIHTDAPAPHSIAPRVHRDLETICAKAIDKEPERRYRTAREFGEDIQRYLDGEAIAARPLGAIPRAWRSIRRHAALAVALAAVLVLASAAAAYFFYSSWRRRADIDFNLRDGIALLEKQDWRNALDKFQKVIVLDPQNQEALRHSNECKKQIEKSGETAGAERRHAATPAYERAKLIIERLDEMAKRGEFKRGTADVQQALVELDAALTHDPSFAEALFLKGRSLHLLGRQADALDAFAGAVAANPTFAAPYFARAAILLE